MAENDVAIKITADSSGFQREVSKVVASTQQIAGRVNSAFSTVNRSLAALGVGISAAAFGGMIKGAIDAADHLNDLSQATGLSVKTLGGLGLSAKQSGTDLDSVARAIGRFNIRVAETVEGDQKAAAAFRALGISIEQLKSSTPDQIFTNVAANFSKYADGPQKAAVANALFSKSYQDLIPLLNAGGDELQQNIAYFEKYSGVTEDITRRADAFNDELEKAKLLNSAFATELAAKLLPSLQGLVRVFIEAKEAGNGFNGIADDIAEGLKGIARAATVTLATVSATGKAIGAFAAAAAALFRGEAQLSSQILKEGQADVERTIQNTKKILDAIDGKLAGATPGRRPRGRPAPGLGSADADKSAKDELDKRLRELERSIKDEQDVLKDRERFLQTYYQDDLISIGDYYARRLAVTDEATRNQLAAYDQELAALRAFAKAQPKDRVETESKIAEVVARRANLERDAALKGIDLWNEQRKAAQAFSDEIADVSIRLQELSGDSVGAALAAFDKANAQRLARATIQAASGDTEESAAGRFAVGQIKALRDVTATQAQLNKVQREYSGILDNLGIAQARIDLQRRAGNITDLDAINARSAAAKDFIGILNQQIDAYRDLASSLPSGEAQEDALRVVERLRLEVEALTVSANELANTLRDQFADAFADTFSDFVTGAKSAKEALRDLEKQFVSIITRMAAKQVGQSLFGSGGAGSGFVDLIAGLFGGKIPGFASGTNYAPGGWAMVGERGPEIVRMPRGAQVIPNDVLQARREARNINVSVNVLPGASRESADQAALAMVRALNRAGTRNG